MSIQYIIYLVRWSVKHSIKDKNEYLHIYLRLFYSYLYLKKFCSLFFISNSFATIGSIRPFSFNLKQFAFIALWRKQWHTRSICADHNSDR